MKLRRDGKPDMRYKSSSYKKETARRQALRGITQARHSSLSKFLSKRCETWRDAEEYCLRWGASVAQLKHFVYGKRPLNSIVLFRVARDIGTTMDELMREFFLASGKTEAKLENG